jgi:S-DNA-T family DNA segregation ATPase FtsK/SpoIIIE
VGGTTGAGKSELLQTLIAGLAVAHQPEELALVLVDYKGGSAFKDCATLPHTVGLVTDLDEHLASRALTSLTAEVKRRERLLAQQGAKDLDDYLRSQTASSPSLPRLLIVVDEFKMLADELPDFVDGLVRIAAIGRSLGVHLVLATQRPGGIVSGDMRANIALRIALRVRDRSDSLDVVESPEASTISDRHPGRALVRTAGLELHEVQTAYCGGVLGHADGDVPAAPVVWPLPWPSLAAEPPRRLGPATTSGGQTELAAFVAAARAAATALDVRPVASPWLPALPEHLPLAVVPRTAAASHRVALGLVDRPGIQSQETWAWDLDTDGPLALVGGARTGRTTALRTIALALSESLPPSAVHMHVLEGTPGPLRHLGALPQVGSIAGVDDARRARRVITRLLEEVAQRRTHGAKAAPRIVLLVDGWEQLEDAFEAIDHGAPTDDLLRLLRDGPSAGISVAVTGGRALTGGRLSAVFGQRLVLAMPDPLDLTLAGVAPESVPARQGPGRAVDPRDGCEVQLAFTGSSPAPADQDHAVAMTATVLGLEYAALPERERPWRIAALPEHVGMVDLPSCSGTRLTVGVGGDALDALGFDPEQRRILVAGPPRSGRSTALATITQQLHDEGCTLAVVTTRRSPLNELRGIRGVHLLGADDVDAFVALRREEPDLAIVVDDADAIDGTPLEGALVEAVRLVDTAGGLVAVAVELHRASAAYRGLVPEVARHGTGLLLGPRSPADGELFRMRVDPESGRLPGRGLLVADGTATPIQIAVPNWPSGGASGGLSPLPHAPWTADC